VDKYLAMMIVGGVVATTGVAMTAYTLFVTPAEGVNIGGPFIATLGLTLLATGGALRGE
jgi:hypothetical protein